MSALDRPDPPRTTLAQLLAADGALPPGLALELIDRLAVRLAAGSYDVGRLVRLSPATVELELHGEPPAAGAVWLLPGPAPAHSPSPAPADPYMAWPELGRALSGPGGLGKADPGGEAAAVYCLGVLLYHMLAGRPLFAARDLDVLATLHLKGEPARPPVADVSPALAALLWRALSRRREERYPSIAGFREAVAGVRSAPATAAEAPSPPQGEPPPPQGEPRPPVAVARPAPPPEAVALYSLETNRCLTLKGLAVAGPDGTREIRVGRGEPGADDAPHVDLGEEPFGRRVARRQAILRYGPAGWTVETWKGSERVPPAEGQAPPTRVNGVALAPGERRPISVGDAIAFGPVRMLLVLFAPGAARPTDAAGAASGPQAAGGRDRRDAAGDEAERTPGPGPARTRTPVVPPSGEVGHFQLGDALATPPHAPSFRATDRRTQAPAVVHFLPLPERLEPALLGAIEEGLFGARELDAGAGVARLLDWHIADAGGAVARPPFLAREYVDGRSVRALLRSQRRVQPGHALQIVEQVATALAGLARSGRVHGAIHPENVFVAADGSVKVTDWAVSYVRRAVQRGARPDGAAGPPSVYHAPETYRGQEPDTRSDLFCLGVLLYELIAGAPPFPPPAGGESGGDAGVWERRLGKDRLALPGVPEAVERIVVKALAVDPLDRYAEPQAMLADIEHHLRPAARRAVLYASSGATYPVDRSQIVLGRLHPGSVPYPDVNLAGEPGGDTVSRLHARLYLQDGRWWIVQQQDVVNWTYVQGRLLRTGEPAPLQDGDRVDVGQVTLTFRTGAAGRDDRAR